MRTYSTIDMIRFARFCKESPSLKPYEAIKAYNEEVKELTPKQRLDNLMMALGVEMGHEKGLLEKAINNIKTKQLS